MILVLALDALDPDLLARFRGEGRLPTLGKLQETGRFGRLRSAYPPVSVPAWSTFLTGLSPRKQSLTLYIMPGFSRYEELLGKLGKHKTGKSCLYIKRLDDVDQKVLKSLITSCVREMRRMYPKK